MLTNVLLIGGAGFIGGHLKNKLESNGTTVDVIDKKHGKNILDEYALVADREYSHVVFLAAEANLRAVKRNPVDAIKTMTVGLMNCLKYYSDSHFTYISSSMVYGNWAGDSVSENDARAPIDLYGQLKLAGEGIVKELHSNYTIIRPTAVYGPGDDPTRVLPHFINLARQNQILTVKYSTGVYNISYGNAVPLETVAKYITKCLGTGSVKVDPLDLEYPKRGSMNITKARTELGYKPTTHVFDGINELLS
jgi:nucleoside-diphosphate-sugar epimerase